MIYLTFDTNIWVYALDDSWVIEDQLDYIEHWVETNQITLLLPEEIKREWKRNKDEQVNVRKKKLNDFFRMAEEILPSAFFSDYTKPDARNKIIQNQLNRIQELIDKAQIIPVNEKVNKRVIQDGLDKKAPLHKKSSVADAIIIYSLIQFAKDNPGNDYIFVTGNKEDFYANGKNNRKGIHPDLESDFLKYNIELFTSLGNELTYPLRERYSLNLPSNLNKIRQDRIKNKLRNTVYNPRYISLLETGDSSFIQNRDTLDSIIKLKKPTKEQVIFVLALIDSDESYKRYFYQNLKNPNWLSILRKQEVFNHRKSIGQDYWYPILYLKSLSQSIKNGKNLELIDEIISIINSYSERENGNPRLWSDFIGILSDLPNKYISFQTLKYIPCWLKAEKEPSLVTIRLTRDLMPKFLDSNLKEDTGKAEEILRYLLSIAKKESTSAQRYKYRNNSYQLNGSSWILGNDFKDELIEKIAKNLSNKVIVELADDIFKLRFDFPLGLGVDFKTRDEKLYIEFDNSDFKLSIKRSTGGDIINSEKLQDIRRLSIERLNSSIIKILDRSEFEYEVGGDNKSNLETLYFLIKYGSHPNLYDEISELGEGYEGRDTIGVLSRIYRDLLNNKFQVNPSEGEKLLKLFISDLKYRIPFFRRICFYVIGKNWDEGQELFWEIIKEEGQEIFCDYHYEKELYQVLYKNQNTFNKEEIKLLDSIIESGCQNISDFKYKGYEEHWKLRWYAALRENSFFSEKYKKLSGSLDKTHKDLEEEGKAKWYGSKSPFTKEELLNKSIVEISIILNDFNPKDKWKEGTIEELGETLSTAIQEEPNKFSDEINEFGVIPYTYAYHLTEGFTAALAVKKEFEWNNVLTFLESYISSDDFINDKLHIEPVVWSGGKDVVLGSVSDLLYEGLKVDDNAFNLNLLPFSKKLLSNIYSQLEPVNSFGSSNMDYVAYALNSVSGKFFRALISYSLRRARNLKLIAEEEKWEAEIEVIWENAFGNRTIDAFIIFGRYFPQIMFLNEEWVRTKIFEFYELEDEYKYALIGGLAYSNPIAKLSVYELLYNHFEFILDEEVTIKSITNNGFYHHLFSYYIERFEDFEDNKGLLWKLLNNGESTDILSFLNFVGRIEKNIQKFSPERKEEIEPFIMAIWMQLVKRFKETINENEIRILFESTRLLNYISELKNEHLKLILSINQCKQGNSFFFYQRIVRNLHRLMYTGNISENAEIIGQILSTLSLDYFMETEKEILNDIVLFLYENNQNKFANKICDELAKNGLDYLVDIYKKYNL